MKKGKLKEFLEFCLWNSDGVFNEFRWLEETEGRKVIYHENKHNPKERFLYIEGTRLNKVVLIAHADTYFDELYKIKNSDKNYGQTNHAIIEENGFFINSIPSEVGIGADDRAGCAMLWLLRDSGHSILIVDGEEHGQVSSHYIMTNYPEVIDSLNAHQFMIQLDRRNSSEYKCYNVGTVEFRKFIEKTTNYMEPDRSAATDLSVLCRDICGVNLSIGYYDEQSANERINIKEWLDAIDVVISLISNPNLPRFLIHYNLILSNDDVNDMLYIITSLYEICGLAKNKCTDVMFDAHENGSAIVTYGTFEEINTMKELLILRNIIAKMEKSI